MNATEVAIKVRKALGDEPERAHALGPEAVRVVVAGWATRAVAAECALRALREVLSTRYAPTLRRIATGAAFDSATTAYPFAELDAAGLVEDDGGAFVLTDEGREMLANVGDAHEPVHGSNPCGPGCWMRGGDDTSCALADPPPPPCWALVEVMGHRSHAGRVCEEALAGVRVLRVDALQRDGSFLVYRYSGAAIFSTREATEAEVRREVVPLESRPCDAFAPAGALPTACDHCGHDGPAHDAAKLDADGDFS